MKKALLNIYIVSLMILLPGCGGGGSSSASQPMNTAIVLSSALAQGLTNTSTPIKGIDVTFALPQSASPILNTDGSLLIGETGLKNLNPKGFILSGSYDTTTRVVHFILLPNDVVLTDLGVGDIARLTVNVSDGAQLTAQNIIPAYKVAGQGSVDISTEVVPVVRIVTYPKP